MDIHQCQQLLGSWCRTKVWCHDREVSLLDMVSPEERNNGVAKSLQLYEATNDLVLFALAGNAKAVKQILRTGMNFSFQILQFLGYIPNNAHHHLFYIVGMADVNTVDHSYQFYYPVSPEVPQPLLAAVWETNNYEVIDVLMQHHPNTSVLYANQKWSHPMPLFFHVSCTKFCDET